VPPGDLPCACAVIDPHRTDSVYPYKYLAGVGVAYKLVQAMSLDPFFKIGRSLLNDLLDLVALGTIADSAPLTGENRIFVKYGLEAINKKPCRTGVEALKRISGVTGDVRSGLLSYTLIPRVNAAGRLDDAGDVVELFITGDIEVAERLAHVLDEQNRNRKKIEARVFSDACEMIDPDNLDSAIVLSSPDWHPGVIGIVASRLLEMYFRPVFLFSEKDGVAKGSARSAPPFHLHNAIAGCSDLLIAFGGHSQAAGLKILSGKLPLFRESINRQVEANIDAGALKPVLEIDAAVTLSDINFGLIKELSLLEPFGESNREPLFGAKDISIINHRIVGNNHLKMQLRQNNVNVDTIGFSMGSHLELIGKNRSMDIVFVPSINEWNGSRTLQLNLRAIRPSV
ncbi:MAG: DHH family phosphoesterase, partial [Nitrospirota bacterium]|nr:DHH family phosphoesterase [Nitrospirota bacterium]